MVFVADDLGGWLVGLLADAARKKLTVLVLGSDQERALRKAATAAVQDTAAEMSPSAGQAGQLAMVISEVFREPVPDAPLARSATLLEGLQAGIARQLAVLDDAGLTGTGQSSADVLGVPGAVLAEKLTGRLMREIMFRGAGGGPLTPLADQLNHDLTHRMLARLAGAGQDAPIRTGGAVAVRVGEADPRRLGVHAAISVPGVPDEVPPEYVLRDVDGAEFGIRARVATAAERGGFVLLVGGSSVGKTRCAVEAVKALLPDWWLVHPAGPAEVAALAQAPQRTVVWLDELQRYLEGEHGLTGGTVRALLNPPHPAVIIGTLWPDRYAAYTAVPAPGDVDPHAREREVLDLASVIRIGPAFSPAEQDRARAAAGRDRRLARALGAEGYGLTQTLAAAPQLVDRWEGARDGSPYAWAVLTAALDAARLGVRAPLTADFLRASAPGYCTRAQQAAAPGNWFEQTLIYATARLHGAAAALSPAGSGMSQVTGYTVADYLLQHATRARHYARVPASTWDALLIHIQDPGDARRLAGSALHRLLYRYAIPLYRCAADADDDWAAFRLADLLAERGDLGELRARADAGDRHAAFELASLLAQHGDLDRAMQILRAHAADGDAASRLADLLARRGDVDELRARADAGDESAGSRLADLLAERGDLDQLRARADAGDENAARRLAGLLALRERDRKWDLDELRSQAEAGDEDAADWLADLLAERGDLDELRARADAGDRHAAIELASLLAQRGDLDELRARADAGDRHAARRLADLLAERGDLNEAVQILHARADAGDGDAGQLAELLTRQGRGEEAKRLRRFGLNPDGSVAHG